MGLFRKREKNISEDPESVVQEDHDLPAPVKKKKRSKVKFVRSIRFRFPLIIVCVLIFVIVALIFVNSNYLETYTIHTKIDTIIQTIDQVSDYAASDFDDDALVELEKTLRSSNIETVILNHLDTLPQVVYASDLNESGKSSKMISYLYGNLPVATEVYEQSDNFIIYKAFDNRLNSYQIDCIGKIDDDTGYVLTTPLESIRETVKLSTNLLTVLGIAAVLIGALLMYLVTLSLTRPIRELSELSEQMAELNFDVRYSNKSHDEIDVLGESMNRMSDRLKKTITDLQAANAQLAKDLEEKQRIDDMRRLFLSNVSHELKTPIALIQGYAEGLQDGVAEDPESAEFYCEVIVDEAQKMNTIVKRLLNLDEIESGHVQLVREVFNLTELIEGVAKSSRMLAKQGDSCELVMDLEPEILVYADEFMIEQVIQNYMSNAYHYVGDPGRVTVTATRQNNRVVVAVHNTGSHIPEEDMEHIWEKFYKVDKARTRSYGGSGIGLSIVKAIMASHGGYYGVRNREDGVEFWFEVNTVTIEEANRIEEEKSRQAAEHHES